MQARPTLALIALLAIPTAASAQHVVSARPVPSAPREAAQFDFLVGQFDLVAHPQATSLAARIHGAPRLLGTWKAWRAMDGWGILDEMRLTDGSGNPIALGTAMRFYDPAARHWSLTTLDVYRGRSSTGTAEWQGNQMLATAQGTDQDGRAFVSRTKYYDITPDGFRFQQDRSYDDGHTWTEKVLTIEARRTAGTAPR